MSQLNRKSAPIINPISTIPFILPEKWNLSNGIPVWSLKAGSQELVKIDFIFDAGSWYQSQNLVAGLSNAFLNQGSTKYTAQEIAEVFDSRGAYLQLSADQQFGNVSILTLTKYLNDILDVTADIIKHPTFPEKEVATHIAKRKQQFIVENNKVKTLALKKFTQVLFGEGHPYANTNTVNDFDRLTREDVRLFHSENYRFNRCKIVVAGNFDNSLNSLLDAYFGDHFNDGDTIQPAHKPQPEVEKQHFIKKDDAVQSAVRIGKQLVNRDHPDFHGLSILTTILGGYFGSRLMANIREEKGYTYGIGATIVTFQHASYITISTEVGTDVCKQAVAEIYSEIEKLIHEPVQAEELDVVKNYLMGDMLRNFDGVFALSGSLRTLVESALDYSHYETYIDELKNITPERLQWLAQSYFQPDSWYEVVAGKNS